MKKELKKIVTMKISQTVADCQERDKVIICKNVGQVQKLG